MGRVPVTSSLLKRAVALSFAVGIVAGCSACGSSDTHSAAAIAGSDSASQSSKSDSTKSHNSRSGQRFTHLPKPDPLQFGSNLKQGDETPAPEHIPEIPQHLTGILVVPADCDDDAKSALETQAQDLGVKVTAVRVAEHDSLFNALVKKRPQQFVSADVIIVPGAKLLKEIESLASSTPESNYLLLGARPDTPAVNVTAVTWDGADSGEVTQESPPSIIERADQALRVGLGFAFTDGRGMAFRLAD
jgi:hypothetical protein